VTSKRERSHRWAFADKVSAPDPLTLRTHISPWPGGSHRLRDSASSSVSALGYQR
jgi:hypothetical protein